MDASIAVLDGEAVTVEHVILPRRQPGEIDVAISAAAICGSDMHTVLGKRQSPARTALGHEGVGRLVAVDDGACDLRGVPLLPGDRVVFALFSACGTCDRCVHGLAMKCRSLVKYGHESVATPPHATGSLATHVRLLPGVPVLRVPDDLTDRQVVSAGCAVATAAAIVSSLDQPAEPRSDGVSGPSHTSPPGPLTRILVYGAGAVGAYTISMLVSLGCSVFVNEPSDERRAIAEQLGARADDPNADRYPIIIEASGNSMAFSEAIGRADIGGRIVAAGSVSPGDTFVTVDPAVLVTRRITLLGVHNYTADDFRWGVDWLHKHAHTLPLDTWVSPPYPLASVNRAFFEMRNGRYLRVLVKPTPS